MRCKENTRARGREYKRMREEERENEFTAISWYCGSKSLRSVANGSRA
jgi:hypothetical protein